MHAYDELPDELRERVIIQDMGVIKHPDPETGVVIESHDVGFFIVIDGVEHGYVIANSPRAMTMTDVYDLVIESGTLHLLQRVGLV